jgi:2,3-diketo-5-methylthio-1-phosphopentane phosphatase
MHAFCDFDGTIAVEDVTDSVLERFATPEWHEFERAWTEGEITAAECMRAQIPLINASLQELNDFLDTIEIDPGFPDFVAFCRRNHIGVSVVSDGVDHFIHRVLANHGVTDIEIIANRLSPGVSSQGFQYGLDTPFASAGCRTGAGVCKCRIIRTPADHFYVGDGRSDFCVSGEAMMVFAKAKLATYCQTQAIPFIPYQGFDEVQHTIDRLLNVTAERERASRLARTA